MSISVSLGAYDKRGYRHGASKLRRIAWYVLHALTFGSWLPLTSPKVWLLRAFGARIGAGVVIRPRVRIKHPWMLSIGDHAWIGEGAWIDNLADVTLGSNVCVSQEAYLLTGNHDYRDPRFGLVVAPVRIEEGAWVGARAIVCPGVVMERMSVLTAGSVLSSTATSCGVYRGNPAALIRERILNRVPGA